MKCCTGACNGMTQLRRNGGNNLVLPGFYFRCHLERFLREHGVHLPVAGALGDLYRRHPELLPQTPEARSRLANSVVRMLAGFRTPAVMDGADCDFLGQVWPLTQFFHVSSL